MHINLKELLQHSPTVKLVYIFSMHPTMTMAEYLMLDAFHFNHVAYQVTKQYRREGGMTKKLHTLSTSVEVKYNV